MGSAGELNVSESITLGVCLSGHFKGSAPPLWVTETQETARVWGVVLYTDNVITYIYKTALPDQVGNTVI